MSAGVSLSHCADCTSDRAVVPAGDDENHMPRSFGICMIASVQLRWRSRFTTIHINLSIWVKMALWPAAWLGLPVLLIPRRRWHWHVDHTGAGVACRVPGSTALVVGHAADRDGSDVARWGYGCWRWCRGDDCCRLWLARSDHRTANDCTNHKAGSRIVVVPMPAIMAAATPAIGVGNVGYGRRTGALHLRCRGLPG